MAQGRMLFKEICTSATIEKLSSDTARLFYTWLIPHLDVNGCYYADPEVLKGYVFTKRKPVTYKHIAKFLKEMEDLKLIYIYGEGRYLFQPDFHRKQKKRQPEREAKPKIPPPALDDVKSFYPDGQYPKFIPCETSAHELRDKAVEDNVALGPLSKERDEIKKQVNTYKDTDDEKPFYWDCEQRYLWFIEFWNTYNKKEGKPKVKAWFNSHVTEEKQFKKIMLGVERWAKSGRWNDKQYQKLPMTFLNGEHWNDEVTPIGITKEHKDTEDAFIKGEI
jgi:hypothetical protein